MGKNLPNQGGGIVRGLASHAFMLGKFLPPHAGHLYVARVGARLARTMSVLVCSTDEESIPGALRAQWMRELLPGCRVLAMHRDIPQEPNEHRDFWSIWRAAVREHHPEPIDIVLGSEPYIFRLAAELEARAVLVDPEREIFRVSGSAIREAPLRNWHHMPEPAQAWYRKRVCLLGPESTGKSSLAARLAERFQTRYMPEYGRTYDAHYRHGHGWHEQDLFALAETHAAMRTALASHSGPLFFEDTDALQTLVWSDFLGVNFPVDRFLSDFEPADLYLLLTPEVGWQDDGTRYFADQTSRERFFDSCRALLRTHGYRHAVVGGMRWENREQLAVDQISRIFPDLSRPEDPSPET